MPAERYYINSPLENDSILHLADQELHHLLHVMRTSVGEIVEVINGTGTLAEAKLVSLKKQHAELHVISSETFPPPIHEIQLAQGIPRANRLDYILEKGTEIGVTKFLLVPTKQSERKAFNEHQIGRMRNLLISALKQSGRLHLPIIELTSPLLEWQQLNCLTFFGELNPSTPSFQSAWQKVTSGKPQSSCFFTGPESGLTEDEYGFLRKLGGVGVNLNPHVLRTDTASIVALGLMAHWNLC